MHRRARGRVVAAEGELTGRERPKGKREENEGEANMEEQREESRTKRKRGPKPRNHIFSSTALRAAQNTLEPRAFKASCIMPFLH